MPRDDFEEKSHYSYQEMMDRLKKSRSRGRGSGGRRRRKQSEDVPKPSPRKIRLIATVAAIGVMIVVAIPVVLFLLSRAQYATDAFRRSVGDRTSELLGKSADFGSFRMQGSSLFSQRLEVIDESDAGMVRRARIMGLRADFDTALHRGSEWSMKKLAAASAQVVVGPPSEAAAAAVREPASHLSKPLFGLDPAPSAFVIGDIFVREFGLAWGAPDAYDTLRGAKLQAQPLGRSATWQVTGGTLHFGELDAIEVVRMTGEISNNTLSIDRGLLRYSAEEQGTLSGKIDLTAAGGARLDVSMSRIDFSRWLDLHHKRGKEPSGGPLKARPWTERIRSGSLSFNATYASSFAPDAAAPSLSGTFTIEEMILRDWHLFSTLGFVFSESGLNNLKFEPIKGAFHWTDGRLEVTDLQAEQRGLIKVAGGLVITEDAEHPEQPPMISATLSIGLPSVDLDKLAGGYPDYFSRPVDGYGWTDIRLSGPLDEPRDDFVDRLPEELRRKLPLAPWEVQSVEGE